MERRKASALAGLLMVLLASFAMFPKPAMAQGIKNAHYWVVGGTLVSDTQLWIFPAGAAPFFSRPPDITPMFAGHNITFTEPWHCVRDNGMHDYGWLVNITVPVQNFTGMYHEWYDPETGIWFNLNHTLTEPGYGWIFLNATGDVDCYTFNNDTGVYWKYPSRKAGELAATTGNIPGFGNDGIPGTRDDGFGNGVNDTKGSSIFILPSTLKCEYWAEGSTDWGLLFDIPWPVIFTTGTAYDIVDEPDGSPTDPHGVGHINKTSELNKLNYTRTGKPWEFYAGSDHPEYTIPWAHDYSNAYVTYAAAWSMLNLWTGTKYEYLDVIFAILYKLMRDDCGIPGKGVLPDIKDDDEEIKIGDVRRAARAYDTWDEGPYGTPKIPPASPNKPQADALFDAAADVVGGAGLYYVGIADVRRIALYYGLKLTPEGLKPA